ncbi:MAG: zinc ribbon domain-containing protein [Clostridiales bacterium]|jgi:hypothetical protein|nr:zinc ribbon domain-containing protein [Clostridiales bacterium]
MATYCTSCGAQAPDDAAFCTSCGAAVENDAHKPDVSTEYLDPPTKQPAQAHQSQNQYGGYASAAPAAGQYGAEQSQQQSYRQQSDKQQPYRQHGDTPPSKDSEYAVVGTGKFLGALLLSWIPVVNLVILIVWACGGCQSRNLRNFARARLLETAIGVAICVAIVILVVSFAWPYLEEFGGYFDYYM